MCSLIWTQIHVPQLYLSAKASNQLPPLSLVNCLEDVKIWMSNNFLKLNSGVKFPKPQLQKGTDLCHDVDGCSYSPSPGVSILGETREHHQTLAIISNSPAETPHSSPSSPPAWSAAMVPWTSCSMLIKQNWQSFYRHQVVTTPRLYSPLGFDKVRYLL